jgi:hypothetical protein
MALERWHSIRIGPLWLTDDHTSEGNRVINEIEGLGVLKRGRVGQVNIALDGTVWKQRFSAKGAEISISFNLMLAEDFETLTGILNDCDTGSNITVAISGTTGDYSFTATTADEYLDFDSTYINTKVAGVSVRLIVVSQQYTASSSAGSASLTGQNVTLTYSGA